MPTTPYLGTGPDLSGNGVYQDLTNIFGDHPQLKSASYS